MRPSDLTIADYAVRVVCTHFGITSDSITSHARPWRLVWPRWCAIALTLNNSRMQLDEAAVLFNRHRTDILHLMARMNDLVALDQKAADEWEELKTKFGRIYERRAGTKESSN